MRSPYRRRYDGPRLIETLTSYFLGWLALAIGVALVVAIVVMALMLVAQPSFAADEHQIRRDCTWDALRYCKAEIVTADRSKIINCMVENKDKLRPKCRQHMW